MKTYEELQDELKEVVAESKKEKKNSIPYIRLKKKANYLHLELLKIERTIRKIKEDY